MNPGKSADAPLDRVAAALVLADPGQIATLEELDKSVAALARWASKHAPENARENIAELARVARELRRYPDGGIRALERIGALFHSVDMKLGCTRPTAPAATPDSDPDSQGPGTAMPGPASPRPSAAAPQLAEDPELIADFITRATEHLESAEEQLIALERHPSDREALNATFRAFHTIKGMAGFLAMTDIQTLAHASESLLDEPRHGKRNIEPATLQQLFAAIDELRHLVDRCEEGRGAEFIPPELAAADPDGGQGGLSADWSPDSYAPQASVTRTLRVDEERLDRLVDAIGELVIAESMTSEAARGDLETWAVLGDLFAQLDKITRELQEMATSLRMLPLRATFRRMARLVRDLVTKTDKDIVFVTEGQDTELDKAMVDLLADPLIHLVRNAVDHGIEPPRDRVAAGKSATGRITLRAFHAGGSVVVEVSDDGRGFDTDRILEKARELGLVGPEETPRERDLLNLVFSPGFSTSSSVTDVSGRGVGMDVVKQAIDSLRGQIEIKNDPGRGATVAVRLPLTLAIIDGMVVRVGEERYILPTLSVVRSVKPEPDDLSTVLGRGEMLQLDEELVRLISLRSVFKMTGEEPDLIESIVVTVEESGHRAGLVIDEIIGQQQIVIKSLGNALGSVAGVSGGAVMPDGRVGLILDVEELVALSSNNETVG